MQKDNHMASVERYTKVVSILRISTKDSSLMVVCQDMADPSLDIVTILETLKMVIHMAKEQKS